MADCSSDEIADENGNGNGNGDDSDPEPDDGVPKMATTRNRKTLRRPSLNLKRTTARTNPKRAKKRRKLSTNPNPRRSAVPALP